jgi:hypothetical protein
MFANPMFANPMFASPLRKRWAAGLAGALVAAAPGLAFAAHVTPAPPLFEFATQGGFVDPGILVGFNPQPDPPGAPATTVSLTNPERPVFSNSLAGGEFALELAITGLGGGTITLPAAPNADGVTSFQTTIDGHTFDGTLQFGPSSAVILPGSWVSFNPQPDPPGDVLGVNFWVEGDPWMSLSLEEDGTPLTLSAVPEPATWAMVMLGLAMIGTAARRRREGPPLIA